MSLTDLLPNFLIGLREGLEAGLVVAILVGAVRRLEPQRSLAAVWTGVVAAITLSLGVGFVLTFTQATLSPRAQEGFAGSLSVIAVAMVTTMVFWMRRAARSLAGELRSKVGAALAVGGAALVITAFLAVAREGLEAALFVWSSAQAANASRVGPLLGAIGGLAVAALLCRLMYSRTLRLNLAKFFTRTGTVLLVIAAGVLAYGIGDLQGAGLVPGGDTAAFDLTGHVSADAWWVALIRSTTNLTPRMTVLQAAGYAAYLVIGLLFFLRRRPVAKAPESTSSAPVTTPPPVSPASPPAWRRRSLTLGCVGVGVPLLLVAGFGLLAPKSAAGTAQPITLTDEACAPAWTAPDAGTVDFAIQNKAGHGGEIYLVGPSANQIVGEVEGLGPGTTSHMKVTIGAGTYTWRCRLDGLPTRLSVAATVRGTAGPGTVSAGFTPVTAQDLDGAMSQYRAYVASQLLQLQEQVHVLLDAVNAGDVVQAKADWLTAHLTWRRVGAAYNAFGDFNRAIDGLAAGLPAGTNDPDFRGFHRIEFDLWTSGITPAAGTDTTALLASVGQVIAAFPGSAIDPRDLGLRTHEILEDSLRHELTGHDDYGSGTSLAAARADADGTQVLLQMLSPLLTTRAPRLATSATAELAALQQAIDATMSGGHWVAVGQLPLTARQRVDGTLGAALETLAPVADLLEVRPS